MTPFSKDEAYYFEKMLRDRNLLVQHGGVVTTTYMSQTKLTPTSERMRPFFDSLVVTPEYIDERIEFIVRIARKILKATHGALMNCIEKRDLKYTPERMGAVNFMLWWGANGKT